MSHNTRVSATAGNFHIGASRPYVSGIMFATEIIESGTRIPGTEFADWKIILVVVRVEETSNVNLVKVGKAVHPLRLPFGCRQRRQQQRRQDGNDEIERASCRERV